MYIPFYYNLLKSRLNENELLCFYKKLLTDDKKKKIQ